MLHYNDVLFTRTMPYTYEEKCSDSNYYARKGLGAKQFVQNIVERSGLSVLWTISYEKLTVLDQFNESQQWTPKVCPNATSRMFLSWYAVNRQSWYYQKSSWNREVIWFICCHALLCSVCILRTCAFCHCVSSITIVLWQKENLANNHLKFQDKTDVILCEINSHLKWHISYSALCVRLNFNEQLITEGRFLLVHSVRTI